jgi:hypothetical protein
MIYRSAFDYLCVLDIELAEPRRVTPYIRTAATMVTFDVKAGIVVV